ncbi:excisionase family DNA binding protein [Bradyrhizobium sp. LB8.2]|uniref:helix-turn-helix domain-containing protein n=1 Tax=unclassified Bradyrhizobium TaxID=2631580 RepID=UPI003397A66B
MTIDPQKLPIIAVSPVQAAKLLGIDARHIANAVRSQELPAHQRGQAVRVTLHQLEQWIESWPHPKRRQRRKEANNADCI